MVQVIKEVVTLHCDSEETAYNEIEKARAEAKEGRYVLGKSVAQDKTKKATKSNPDPAIEWHVTLTKEFELLDEFY